MSVLRDMFSPPVAPGAAAGASPVAAPAAAQPPGAPPAKSFDIVDLKQYFHVVVKRIWLVALCFVIALAVTVVKLVRQVPVYRSSTSLLLSKGLPVPQQVKMADATMGESYMDTQLRIIQSNLLISRARERMNRPADEISQKLVRIAAEVGWKTAFIYIRCESTDPVFAADFANAMAEEYLDFKAEERMDTSQSTVISLTQQANRLRDELRKAEERVLAFEKENSVVAIQERGNVAARYLGKLSSQAAELRTERMLLEAQQPLLSGTPDDVLLHLLNLPSGSVPGAAQPPIGYLAPGTNEVAAGGPGAEGLIEHGVVEKSMDWVDLRRQKVLLESKLADLRTRYRDAHPEIQKTIQAVKENDKLIELELQFALHEYYTTLDAYKIKEQAVRRAESEWEDEALASSRRSHEYASLQREVSRLSSLYDLLFNRLKEVDVSIGIEPESVKIIERATPSGAPITPRKLQSIFLAAIVGLGVGLGLVFGLEYIDDSIRYPEEVTRSLGLPFLGVIPAANWDPDDLRTHVLSNIDQKSGLTEAYRNLRSAIMFSTAPEQGKCTAITSAVPKEGKTTTCLNVAVSFAQAGMRVLLVDSDLRRGELHKFFGLEGGRGFADVLIGQAKPESVIQRTGIPNLDLIPTGPFPVNPAELVLRGEFRSFMEYAKRTYDKILLDCPPVMAVSESSILASFADSCIFVVWAGQTSRKLSQLALNIIRQRGANVMGCVLNNLEFGRVGYYYYSTYYGYYDYDYRYERTGEPVRR
jgi:capsular exopolysaccharide synthesis family protein